MAPSSPATEGIVKGAFFADQKASTKAMRQYAASHNMTVKLASENQGGAMLTYQCVGGVDCRFQVRMLRSHSKTRSGYFVSSCNLVHNKCTGRAKLTASQVREDELIRSIVAKDPRVNGRLLIDHVKRLRGAEVSLSEAYRARNLILDDLFGSVEDGYRKLESLVIMWKVKNPTSYVDCHFNGEGEFVRVFVSHPYAPLYELNGQKVTGVDGAFLRHGNYLVLVGKDGDNTNIVLAVAVCSSESEESYEWFYQCCLNAGVNLSAMPVFADRETGILAAFERLGATSLRYCTRHIYHEIQDKFKGKFSMDMESILYRIQAARSEDEYEEMLTALALKHEEIATYIRGIDPMHWVLFTALRSSRLYEWRSTNFVESETQNVAAPEPRKMLPFQFLQHYMETFMREAYDKREVKVARWLDEGHDLTKYARDKLDESAKAAAFCTVEPSDSRCMYVYDARGRPLHRRAVGIEARTCSCTFFDQYGIPCKHFIAAQDFLKRSAERFTVVDECFKIRAYAALYGAGAETDIQLVLNEELSSNPQCRPPEVSSTPKRKKKEKRMPNDGDTVTKAAKVRRMPSDGDTITKAAKVRRMPSDGDTATKAAKVRRACTCTNCGQHGHNRRSCPETHKSLIE